LQQLLEDGGFLLEALFYHLLSDYLFPLKEKSVYIGTSCVTIPGEKDEWTEME
jgi:hypothetical protein